ncbi:MAG: GYF domain-containing protein [Muribaculaceae bacterium]|nr:GYF domain-containing protein [Muribaculaceae bacterium]
MEYFAIINHEQVGPITKTELRHLDVYPETMMWREGLDDWKPASELPELADLFQEPSAEISPANGYTITPAAEGYRNMVPHSITALIACTVLVSIFGSWPAIFALINAIKAHKAFNAGDYEQAIARSRKAAMFVTAAWILTAIISIAVILFFVLCPGEAVEILDSLARPYKL